MSQRLENARNLYMEGIRDGKPREAVTKYTGDRYTQHSTGVRDGVEGFVEFFESFIARNPPILTMPSFLALMVTPSASEKVSWEISSGDFSE